jgi:hypothetical protein
LVGFVTVYLSPRAKENFELREKYVVPYRQWCSDFFGELKEFKVRYVEQQQSLSEISDIQIVLDYWSL